MTTKTKSDNHLTTSETDAGQEGWEILGVPLRPAVKADVRMVAKRAGLRPAQWARQVITLAVAAAKAA